MVIIFCEQKTKKDETILIICELICKYAISGYFNLKFIKSKKIDLINFIGIYP